MFDWLSVSVVVIVIGLTTSALTIVAIHNVIMSTLPEHIQDISINANMELNSVRNCVSRY